MADPREIEGSKARAADRGKPEGMDQFIDPRPALGSMEVVEELVRQYLGELISNRVRYHADQITPEQAVAAAADQAKKFAAIFMGRDAAYFALPWNSPEQLGAHLARHFAEPPQPDEAAETFLTMVAADLMAILVEHEDAKIDDEAAEFRMGALIEDAVHTLLGLENRGDEPA